MKKFKLSHLRLLLAALAVLGAAICANAQAPVKQNAREAKKPAADSSAQPETKDETRYIYEFKQPDFYVSRIRIEHDALGRGRITFLRKGNDDSIEEAFALSPAATTRIKALWDALKFLDSTTNYQAERQFPHLGTVRLEMKRGQQNRTAEFNWTDDVSAKALAAEYWKAADQAILVFDLEVSRENLPLESPKLMDRLDQLFTRNGLSDPKQLIPLLRDLSTDERLPLITRNHATRILKKIEK